MTPSSEPWPVAEDALRRRRLVGDGGVRTGDEDDVGRVLHQRLEAGLAAAGVERFGQHLTVEGQPDLGGQRLERVRQVDRQLVRAAARR